MSSVNGILVSAKTELIFRFTSYGRRLALNRNGPFEVVGQ